MNLRYHGCPLPVYLNSCRGFAGAALDPEDVLEIVSDERYRLWLKELPPPAHERVMRAASRGSGCIINRLPGRMSDVLEDE